MKTSSLVALLIAAMLALGQAQESNKAGTSAAQFLKIGVGGRSMGMGSAAVGIARDPSALYWNPSGIVDIPSLSLYASHTNWFADIKHQYFAIILPVSGDHAVGIGATILSMDDIEITTETQPKGTGNFYSASDVAIGVSYGVRLVDFFTIGGTVKYVSQQIYNESASAVALDIGTTLRTGYQGIKIGMAFSNFGTTLKLEGRDLRRTYDPNPNSAVNVGAVSFLGTESWELPTNFRVGIGWELLGGSDAAMQNESNSIILAVDANHPNDGPEFASVGVEYKWRNLVALRSGYQFNDDVRNWSYGLGLRWEVAGSASFGVDYAFSELHRLGPIHVFSLSVGF
ncbi:MAG: PorV/PorQ family protein [Ignavibacteria bacterium]|nr:PorV/PorQ family protein [Ignavibacteria bacterium]